LWYHAVFCNTQGLLRDSVLWYHAVFCSIQGLLRDSGLWYHAVFCKIQGLLRDSGLWYHAVFCNIQGLLRDSGLWYHEVFCNTVTSVSVRMIHTRDIAVNYHSMFWGLVVCGVSRKCKVWRFICVLKVLSLHSK
jgi:hypothetical protein